MHDMHMILPAPPLRDAPARGGDPLEFLDETYPTKTRGMGAWDYRMLKIL